MSIPTSADLRPPSEIREAQLLRLAFLFLIAGTVVLSLGLGKATNLDWNRVLSPFLFLPVWGSAAWLIHRKLNLRQPGRDPLLLPLVLLLSGWGMILNWRLSFEYGARQTAWFVVSIALLLALVEAPPDLLWLRRYRLVWLSLGLLLTAATLIFGTNPSGGESRLWLGCCGMYMQPSEPLRLLLVAYLASYLAERISSSSRAQSAKLVPVMAPLVVVWVVAIALLAAQRDLGAGSLFLGLLALLLYIAFERWEVLALGAGLVVAGGLAGQVVSPVVQARLLDWLNPFSDPTGSSYQVLQSVIALAHGGLFGAGPGIGLPMYVPAVHTDFIYSALIEEWGLVGGIAVLGMYAVLVGRGLMAAARSRYVYSGLLAAGLSAALGLQAILILGGTLLVLPLTGVTLPFLSYGGSSLTTSFVAAGILILVSGERSSQRSLGASLDRVHAGLLLGWGVIALVLGWWVLVRGPEMLDRPENPRISTNLLPVLAVSALPPHIRERSLPER
ncbi:MAG TPA: FtsW/RodA/SpoVE family cell cycle protein [Anaerolineales bacterium]|nr:FtsW/RodA/SpoVE family cell cycle protein [Anaerolineales bacterium]